MTTGTTPGDFSDEELALFDTWVKTLDSAQLFERIREYMLAREVFDAIEEGKLK